MIILGLDPGLATTGYALIELRSGRYRALDWGIITTLKSLTLPTRLQHISRDLTRLIKRWRPKLSVVESVYFAKNAKTAIVVAHARGVILLTLRQSEVPVLELTPLQMKLRITSSGNAPKTQVQFMVKKLLDLQTSPQPDDAADALALALCGGFKSQRQR